MIRNARFLTTKTSKRYDIIITGGGVAGCTLAKRQAEALSSSTGIPHHKTIHIGLLSAGPPPPPLDGKNNPPNPRAYALSPSSLHTLGGDTVQCLKDCGRFGGVYDKMQIWESDGPGVLHFTRDDLVGRDSLAAGSGSDGECYNEEYGLGAVVEDQALVSALWKNLEKFQKGQIGDMRNCVRIDMITGATVNNINAPLTSGDNDPISITYKNKDESEDQVLHTKLLVGADGGNSFVRSSLGMPTVGFGYDRKAVICTVRLKDCDKVATAYQRFFPNGPIALLPTCDPMYANIVWSTIPEESDRLVKCTSDEFVNKLNEALQAGPALSPPLIDDEVSRNLPPLLNNAIRGLENIGQSVGSGLALASSYGPESFCFPPIVTAVDSKRYSFELKLQHAKRYVGPRVALIGDAAHSIHPMAGQGLNLGIADAESLTNYLKSASESGSDLGSSRFLELYESERQRAVLTMMGGIQFIHESFSTQFAPLLYWRSAGINFVNASNPIRQMLANVAAGNAGAGLKT